MTQMALFHRGEQVTEWKDWQPGSAYVVTETVVATHAHIRSATGVQAVPMPGTNHPVLDEDQHWILEGSELRLSWDDVQHD